jgi:hypothetical protein
LVRLLNRHFSPEDGGIIFVRNFDMRITNLHGVKTQNIIIIIIIIVLTVVKTSNFTWMQVPFSEPKFVEERAKLGFLPGKQDFKRTKPIVSAVNAWHYDL